MAGACLERSTPCGRLSMLNIPCAFLLPARWEQGLDLEPDGDISCKLLAKHFGFHGIPERLE
jgi:hypothetical protein